MQHVERIRSVFALRSLLFGPLLAWVGCASDVTPASSPPNVRGGCSGLSGAAGCSGCIADGSGCDFSINCIAGAICNLPAEELFDPERPECLCIKVVCNTDADCHGGKRCTLERICRHLPCQTDAECGGLACLGGECRAPLAAVDVKRCEVISPRQTLFSGEEAQLAAVVVGSLGLERGFELDWIASSASISVSGSTVRGLRPGVTTVRARVRALECQASTEVESVAPLSHGGRVIVQTVDGIPISGALVETSTETVVSDARGHVYLSHSPDSIIVRAPDRATVRVLRPSANDLLVRLPLLPEASRANFRGFVDLSEIKRADLQLAWVGRPIRRFEDFGLESLGALDPVVVNAPELGLDDERLDLPGGFMISLGSSKFTTTSTRCGPWTPAVSELGCFRVSSEPESKGLWTLGAQEKLSTVTPWVGKLSTAVEEWQTVFDAAIVAPATLYSGTSLTARPEVPPELKASQRPLILTRLRIPALPETSTCSRVLAVVAAESPLGLVPVARAVGWDGDPIFGSDAPADGVTDEVEEPFGQNSDPIDPSTLGLALPPLTAELALSPILVWLTVFDRSRVRTRRSSSIVEPLPIPIGPDHRVESEFLAYLDGTLDTAGRSLVFSNPPRSGYLRVDFRRPGVHSIAWLSAQPSLELAELIASPDLEDPRMSLEITHFDGPWEGAQSGPDRDRPRRFSRWVRCGELGDCDFR